MCHMKIPKNFPDWRSYKVEEIPELMWTKKALQVHGLKDPWLRNEVWRYAAARRHGANAYERMFNILKIGFKKGLVLAIITAAAEKVWMNSLQHGDHDEHGAAHH